MPRVVTIFGTDSCPYTTNARRDYEKAGAAVEYRNVERDPASMKEMLSLTGGRRNVPVVLEGGKATVGYGGS